MLTTSDNMMGLGNETTELAKWIKKNPGVLNSIPKNIKDIKGRINYVRDSALGQDFLREKLDLLHQTSVKDNRHHLLLSGYYSALKDFEKAFESIDRARELLRLDPDVKDRLGVQEYIQFVRGLSEDEKEVLAAFYRLRIQRDNNRVAVVSSDVEKIVSPEGIQSRDLEGLSSKTFRETFCKGGTPVLLHGFSGPKWTEQCLVNRIGHKTVELKRIEDSSDEWACLVPSRVITVKEFIDSASDREYLFDWSISLHCPNGELEFETPTIFLEGDILKRTHQTSLYHNSWPSLFVSKAGMGSRCHVDAFASHFWMYLVKGKKKWTFFNPEVLPRLRPAYHSSLDPSFTISEDLVMKLPRKEVILTEGELLFVPCGWPHIVVNVEDSIAVSGNFVNESNLEPFVDQLKMISLSDPCHCNFMEELFENGLIF